MCIRDSSITDLTEVNTENKFDTNINKENSLTESTVMSGLEVHSTPIPVQNRELSKSADIDDSGIQITPPVMNKNKQFDNNDVMNMMQLFLEQQSKMSNDINKCFDMNYHKFDAQNTKFEALSSDINAKLHELSSNVSEQKIRCESSFNNFNDKFNEQNLKFNEIKGE